LPLLSILILQSCVVTHLILMVFFCKSSCAPRDPATDSVRVDPSAIVVPEAVPLEQETQAERFCSEDEQRMLETEAAERARVEEEERCLREEEEAREQARLAEEARLLEEEARERARLAEEARLREEELLRQEYEEEARRIEAERLQKERQDSINSFCTRYGFHNLKEPRRAGCSVLGPTSTYALHQAAELGDAKIVEMMLEEGASPLQQNSSKKTATQLAQKKNKGGSHDAVLQALRKSSAGGA